MALAAGDIYLALAARAHASSMAALRYAEDVKSIGPTSSVTRHRYYEAEAESINSETIVDRIFAGLPAVTARDRQTPAEILKKIRRWRQAKGLGETMFGDYHSVFKARNEL